MNQYPFSVLTKFIIIASIRLSKYSVLNETIIKKYCINVKHILSISLMKGQGMCMCVCVCYGLVLLHTISRALSKHSLIHAKAGEKDLDPADNKRKTSENTQ